MSTIKLLAHKMIRCPCPVACQAFVIAQIALKPLQATSQHSLHMPAYACMPNSICSSYAGHAAQPANSQCSNKPKPIAQGRGSRPPAMPLSSQERQTTHAHASASDLMGVIILTLGCPLAYNPSWRGRGGKMRAANRPPPVCSLPAALAQYNYAALTIIKTFINL